MSLLQIQVLLARLYTDPVLQQRFFEAPEVVGKEFGLTPEEVRQIQEISAKDTRFFAHSLVHKRLGQVQKLLSGTARVMSCAFNRAFHDFAPTFVPSGTRKHHLDALNFAVFLQKQVLNKTTTGKNWPPWLGELLQLETSWIRAYFAETRWRMKLFRYPVWRLLKELEHDTQPELSPQWTLLVWWRLSRGGKLHHQLFPRPLSSSKSSTTL
jgi:hypothetical protein